MEKSMLKKGTRVGEDTDIPAHIRARAFARGVSTSMVSGFEPALREIVKSIQAAAAVAAASENSEPV